MNIPLNQARDAREASAFAVALGGALAGMALAAAVVIAGVHAAPEPIRAAIFHSLR